MDPSAEIGIIGGTGISFSEIFDSSESKKVHTPYGSTSDDVVIGEHKGKSIAFIPRHGRLHSIPPHKVNSRANIWALKSLGVSRILAPSAVGSLKDNIQPGDIVIPNQFIDFTKRREYTFYDGRQVCHISSADPFCSELMQIASSTANKTGCRTHINSVYLCIEGPRFSTRAESKFFRENLSADVIGMTVVPECVLAREMEICYVSLATVTDYDVWSSELVSSKNIIAVVKENSMKISKLILEMIPEIPMLRNTCVCPNALDGAFV
ncbi:MAG TPA: S-methyl-5'-thioadenosine phosphorylase [Nitrososphaeraceae archaeon]|jgi:5'-methylthioadenosine phosphorylase